MNLLGVEVLKTVQGALGAFEMPGMVVAATRGDEAAETLVVGVDDAGDRVVARRPRGDPTQHDASRIDHHEPIRVQLDVL